MKNKTIYADKAPKTVKELNLGSQGVISVHDYDYVIDALKQVAIRGITAVVVVNPEGKLVGDVGAHDIRLVNPGSSAFVENMIMKLKLFLSKAEGKAAPVVVYPSTTLDQVITQLEENKVHRVFITEDGKPTGIISLGDVIKCLLQ